MEIYLPAQDAVKVKIGADARIVFDIAPEYAARAKVSFVAPEAQFTPKQVETRSERDKLMFRVKLSVPPERVLPYIERVKTGIRGVGYVRLDDAIAWPEHLDRQSPRRGPAAADATSSRPNGTAKSGPSAARRQQPHPRRRPRRRSHPRLQAQQPPSRESRTRWSPPVSHPVRSMSRSRWHRSAASRTFTERPAPSTALTSISRSGRMVGLIGPDGVGKSSLMGLIAGAKKIQEGRSTCSAATWPTPGIARAVCPRIAYMPQGLGKNLYLELSVFENIDFFGRLFGLSSGRAPAAHRRAAGCDGPGAVPRPPRRQALGRHEAEARPVLRADPRSRPADPRRADHRRRSALAPQFWELIDRIRARRPGMSVLVSTAYMDEARAVRLAGGDGRRPSPRHRHACRAACELTGADNLEEAFIALLPEEKRAGTRNW